VGEPVPDRTVEAGAWLVSERGPATVTLEAVTEAARRSVHGRYAIFGTRDELLAAIRAWYGPLGDLVRVATAMLAHLLDHPDGPTARIVASALIRAAALPARYLGTTSAWALDHSLNDAKAG
jgi:hypothetical protein